MTDNVNELRAQLARAEAEQARKAEAAQQRQRDAERAFDLDFVKRWPQLDEALRREVEIISEAQSAAVRVFDLSAYLQAYMQWVANRYAQQHLRNVFNAAINRQGLDLAPKPDLRYIPVDSAVADFLNAAAKEAADRGIEQGEDIVGEPEQVA